MDLKSLWPGDTIWRHGTRSTLAQVMACCLTAPSHYLNQCWLIIVEVPWHLSQGVIRRYVKIAINKSRLKIAVLKWHLGLPGANELKPWLAGLRFHLNSQNRHLITCPWEQELGVSFFIFGDCHALCTVECRYNAVQYIRILLKRLPKLRQNISQMLDPQKTHHTSP